MKELQKLYKNMYEKTVHGLQVFFPRIMYLKDEATERQRKIEIFHLLVHSPKDCSSHGWARQEPGVRNCVKLQSPSTWAIFLLTSQLY